MHTFSAEAILAGITLCVVPVSRDWTEQAQPPPPSGVAWHMISLRAAEELNPLVAGSLLAEAAPSMHRHLRSQRKLHDMNSHYLLNGADGRQQVWSCSKRAPMPDAPRPKGKAGGSDDGPCFAVVCGAGCNWEKELSGLQRVPELTGSQVLLKGNQWQIEGVTPCCKMQKCVCNGVPRIKLTHGSSTMTALLPVVRACIAGIR